MANGKSQMANKKKRLGGFLICHLLICYLLFLPGCLERRVSITSEPSGATVYANDVELGRTPVDASFKYYGTYDVRIEKDGYEPRRVQAKASTPLYEYPPLDLGAAALPMNIEHVVHWNFTLEPARELVESKEDLERGLTDRAKAAREQMKEKSP
jgi:hypothetical protein